MKEYKVNKVEDKKLIITGKGEHQFWDKANVLSDFVSPWDNEDVKKIEFKSLWDTENLYFYFKVFDDEVHIDKKDNSTDSIGKSDRVELFFRKDASLNPYYCLEIDPTPRIMDFSALPNRNFDFNWNWPKKDINVKSHISPTYFTVEGAISLASLNGFGLLKNNKIETGIYRAKFNKQDDASFQPTWISWVNPNTEAPEFHTPSSFGELHLIA